MNVNFEPIIRGLKSVKSVSNINDSSAKEKWGNKWIEKSAITGGE